VVHNGIIENYEVLKKDLLEKGYIFRSETDSEVLATLVEDMRSNLPGKDLAMVVSAALELCIGTFGAVFLFRDQEDLMIGARRGSPLILGLNAAESGGGYFLASDACAIVGHTRDVVYLNDGETIECKRGEYKIHDTRKLAKKARALASSGQGMMAGSSDAATINPVVRLEMKLEEIEKGGYDHFMLKEIHDQDTSLGNCIRGRLRMHEGTTPMGSYASASASATADKVGSNGNGHEQNKNDALDEAPKQTPIEFSPAITSASAA